MPDQELTQTFSNDIKHKQCIRRANEQQILVAAERIFAEYGFKGATTAKIAEEAELPKANLHYYFPTKEVLYRRVIEDMCETWFNSAANFGVDSDPKEALTSYIHAKMDLSRQRPMGSRIWANEMLHGARFTQTYISLNVKEWLEKRIDILEQWVQDGKIAPIDPRHLIYMIWATTQHYADFNAQIEILNDNKALSDAEFEQAKLSVTDMILRGVGLT